MLQTPAPRGPGTGPFVGFVGFVDNPSCGFAAPAHPKRKALSIFERIAVMWSK
jgi:hypothetical protein